MKLDRMVDDGGNLRGYSFECPACGFSHAFYVAGQLIWKFNGDMDRPTFTPSLRNRWTEGEEEHQRCCHLNLTDGVLHFHGDCTHELAGKQVPLAEVD